MILQAAHHVLPDTVQQVLPSLDPWIQSLTTNTLAVELQNYFAFIEVFHILGLFMLGSATILICLRLIGVGLLEASPSLIYRNTRWLLLGGVVLAIASGLLMGLSNAGKLYNNSAFLFKMVAMVAGIVFSYAVMVPAAKADGKVGGGAKVGLIVAMLIWLLALAIMVSKIGSNVGTFHLIYAGALVVFFAMKGAQRWIMFAGAVLIVAAWQLVTHVFVLQGTTDAQLTAYMNANKLFMYLSAFWVFGWAALNIFGVSAPKTSGALARLVGYATILVWVTVGAGGRWIGLT
jgi:hypothetical protein